MRTASIFASYEPVQNYLTLAANVIGRPLAPDVSLAPIDAFLLQQLVDSYPVKLAIIDMASEVMLGTSTVFWTALNRIRKVLVIEDDHAPGAPSVAPWKDLVSDALNDDLRSSDRLTFLPHGKNALESASDLAKHISPTHQIVFMVAFSGSDSDRVIEQLSRLLNRHKNAIAVVTPFGAVGSCRNLESALGICRSESTFQFSLLREISPFCASSKVGLIYPRNNMHVTDILHRVQQFYEGNFDFLGLVEANVELQGKMQVCLANSEQLRAELLAARDDLARVRRSLGKRTEELAAAYATADSDMASSHPKDGTWNDARMDEQGPPNGNGHALGDFQAVMAWLKRGPR
jgi:hypothetical protein